MILKIRDACIEGKWFYYDKIARVSVDSTGYKIHERQVVDREDEKHVADLYFQSIDKAPQKGPIDQVTVCCVRFGVERGDVEILFGFNTEAYLLNDEGKTIERI